MHLIEGLDDGRYAIYFKVHHSLVDGVSALRMLARMLSEDPDRRDMPPPWAPPRAPSARPEHHGGGLATIPVSAVRGALDLVGEAAGLVPVLARTVSRGLNEQSASLSF